MFLSESGLGVVASARKTSPRHGVLSWREEEWTEISFLFSESVIATSHIFTCGRLAIRRSERFLIMPRNHPIESIA